MDTQVVKIFDALSNETRLAILKDFLSGHDSVCAEIKKQLSKSQPTLSHHIGKLVDANIISEKKIGVNCHYSVNKSFLKNLGFNIDKILSDKK